MGHGADKNGSRKDGRASCENKGVKSRFALFFGNRGFFPSSLIESARREVSGRLAELGHDSVMMDAGATRLGAVETALEGRKFAGWLKENAGRYDGIILCLANFGDECGAAEAMKYAGVPILIHAYPDELDKMGPSLRRDAFCGKFSVMDVFCQYGIPFTALKPHTVSPHSELFAENIDYFDRVCRVAGGMRDLVVGAVGARTTPFKTVRIDEIALQKHGITVETLDLSSIIARVNVMKPSGSTYESKKEDLAGLADWGGVPERERENLAKLGVVLDEVIAEYGLDVIALRCWIELQQQLGISPCVLLGALNDRMLAAACEVDVGNAVMMHVLKLASGSPPMCLDWNNNYADEPDKCVLFHCGPVAPSRMRGKGRVVQHAILSNADGVERSFGCNQGIIRPMDITFGSLMTSSGGLNCFLGEGKITEDPLPGDFFGCAGVAEIENLQDVLLYVGRNGYRHHVSAAGGSCARPAAEALGRYLGWNVALPQDAGAEC